MMKINLIVEILKIRKHNEIYINEIVDNDLIQLSTQKAMANNLVSLKLIELIKEGQNKINNDSIVTDTNVETFTYEDDILNNDILNNNILNNNILNNNINYKNIDEDDSNNIITLPEQEINKIANNPIQNKVNCEVLSILPLQNIVKIEPYTGSEFASY